MNARSAVNAVMSAQRRGALLRILADQPGYGVNDAVLQSALEAIGHVAGRDLVHTDIAWLQEQGLLSTQNAGPLLIASLTTRGDDVARGRVIVPGVQRPTPNSE